MALSQVLFLCLWSRFPLAPPFWVGGFAAAAAVVDVAGVAGASSGHHLHGAPARLKFYLTTVAYDDGQKKTHLPFGKCAFLGFTDLNN